MFDEVASITGRRYNFFDYVGHPQVGVVGGGGGCWVRGLVQQLAQPLAALDSEPGASCSRIQGCLPAHGPPVARHARAQPCPPTGRIYTTLAVLTLTLAAHVPA